MVVPNKEAEEKIKQAVSGKGEHGLTRDQCEDLGIPYKEPEGLTIDAEGYVSLLEEDLEDLYKPCILDYSDFSWAAENKDTGSTVYTKNGDTLPVKETVEEIFKQMEQWTYSPSKLEQFKSQKQSEIEKAERWEEFLELKNDLKQYLEAKIKLTK